MLQDDRGEREERVERAYNSALRENNTLYEDWHHEDLRSDLQSGNLQSDDTLHYRPVVQTDSADGADGADGTDDAAQVLQRLGSIHQPVLLEECVQLVTAQLPEHAVVVDCTLGLAGHAMAFLQRAQQATLIGIDRDEEALARASERMQAAGLASRFRPVHAAFDEVSRVLDEQGIDMIDAAFMDLGLSSLQIDERERGFSYAHDAPLDMRMDTSQTLTAAHILASYSQRDLTSILRRFGEEQFASLIAKTIVKRRESAPLERSSQLNELVDAVVPKAHRRAGNPAKRVFQALRIAVNGELDKLAATLPQLALRLAVGGRLVVESYHSLEDATVKRFMNTGLQSAAPAGMPVIPESEQPFFAALTHGALMADEAERARNARSASVRLRAVALARPIPPRWVKEYESAAREKPLRELNQQHQSHQLNQPHHTAQQARHTARRQARSRR